MINMNDKQICEISKGKIDRCSHGFDRGTHLNRVINPDSLILSGYRQLTTTSVNVWGHAKQFPSSLSESMSVLCVSNDII